MIISLKRGDSKRERFDTHVRPHFEALYATARRLTMSTHDAEDLVQEVCLKAFARLDELMRIDFPRAWLLKASRWSGAIGLRAGHDDNVALRDEAGLPTGTTAESPMADFFAVIRGPWSGRSGFRLDGSAYVVRFFDADQFDQSQFRGGLFYDWRPGDWRIRAGAHASVGTLGGDPFDRKVGANASLLRYLGINGAIDLRYVYDDVRDADSEFAGIAGSRQQIDLRYRWYRSGHRLQVHYGLETNDRLDPGVSPDRTRFGIDYFYMPAKGLGYGAGAELRNSEYGGLATPRDEDLLTLTAELNYTLRNDWQVVFEVRFSDNDSTDATFTYDRTQLTIGAMKLF
jgi:hypothetical protein